jgi:hypothetical protein
VEVALRGLLRNQQGSDERWARPGQLNVGHSLEDFWARVEPDSLVMSLEWALGSLGSRAVVGLPTLTLSSLAHARLEAIALELVSTASDAVRFDERLPEIVDLLRGAGAPLDEVSPSDLDADIDADDHRIAAVMSDLLCNLAKDPKSVDLEVALDRSRARVTECVGRFARRFGLNGEDWRTIRDRWRLIAAGILATHPRMQGGALATAVGYRSPRALHAAFARAGFPKPSEMRAAADAWRGQVVLHP